MTVSAQKDELTMQLRIHRMRELLPLDGNTVCGEERLVQVRTCGLSRDVGRRSEMPADVDQTFASIALRRQRR